MKTSMEKALELGETILVSDFSRNLEEAHQAFLTDEEAKDSLELWQADMRRLEREMEIKTVSRGELQKKHQELVEREKTLQQNLLIKNLMDAEDIYNQNVNEILQTVRFTIMGRNR